MTTIPTDPHAFWNAEQARVAARSVGEHPMPTVLEMLGAMGLTGLNLSPTSFKLHPEQGGRSARLGPRMLVTVRTSVMYRPYTKTNTVSTRRTSLRFWADGSSLDKAFGEMVRNMFWNWCRLRATGAMPLDAKFEVA